MYIRRNPLVIPSWTEASSLEERARTWNEFQRARLARAAEIEGLKIDAHRFVKWLLDPGNIATRPTSSDKHQKLPMRGRHVSRGAFKNLRGSDLSERVYVAVRVFELKGFTNKAACIEVAEALDWKWKLPKSKRGRPSVGKAPDDLLAKAQRVRSLLHKYRSPDGSPRYRLSRREMKPDPLILQHVGSFLFFEDWLELTRPQLETPEGHAGYERVLGAGYIDKFLPPRQ